MTSDNEQDITNGIIKVVSGQQRKVYFTQGHGEKDTTSADRDGYNAIAAALGRENYTVEKLVVAQQGAVPDDASVVVVAGPRTDFFPPEVDALKKYLDKQGKLLLEIDPPDKADSPPLTNLIALAHDWGIQVGNNVVVDVSGMGRLIGTDASVPVAASYPSHPITAALHVHDGVPAGARGVAGRRRRERPHGADVRRDQPAQLGGDRHQGAAVDAARCRSTRTRATRRDRSPSRSAVTATAAAATPPKPGEADAPKPETRVVVFGDSDFAANAGLGIQGNRDLFMNTIGWLSQQENLISIRPKEADDRRITLTATQQANVIWLSLLIIPGFMFGDGHLHLVAAERLDARSEIDARAHRRPRRPRARTSTSSRRRCRKAAAARTPTARSRRRCSPRCRPTRSTRSRSRRRPATRRR